MKRSFLFIMICLFGIWGTGAAEADLIVNGDFSAAGAFWDSDPDGFTEFPVDPAFGPLARLGQLGSFPQSFSSLSQTFALSPVSTSALVVAFDYLFAGTTMVFTDTVMAVLSHGAEESVLLELESGSDLVEDAEALFHFSTTIPLTEESPPPSQATIAFSLDDSGWFTDTRLYVDNVSVTAIATPIPGAVWVLGFLLIGLLGLGKRSATRRLSTHVK
jgi:hypothetical protein